MKKYYIILLVILGCNQHKKVENKSGKINQEIKETEVQNVTEKIIEKKSNVKKELKKFYECDKIEHFYLNISEEKVMKLLRIENKTKNETILQKLLVMNFPESITETNFESILLKNKFIKTELNKKKKIEIENIFSQKDSLKTEFSSCIAFYRDVFVFKKNNSIIGIAKICFGCGISQFRGTKVDTEGFGLYTELDKLEKIIRNK
jgi:hypothetical protein